MATLKVGKSLQDTDVLWRYLTLDKFIDLVDSKSLFFAPLAWYAQTDPFEGYVPQVAMEAMASIPKKFQAEQAVMLEKLAQMLPDEAAPQLRKLREDVERHVPTMKAIFKNVSSCLMVNCWYKSSHESEGMWGLYSKNGVAIKTSVGALKSSIISTDLNPAIHLGSIKYIDFSDASLTPPDCVSEDGQLFGMIKRIAYSHEQEVRMYITRDRRGNMLEIQDPAPMRVSVDIEKLLEAVVISPFAGESISQSVRAICKWAKVNSNLVSKSNLLDNCEYLLDAYS
ncbi:MAG: DUF2971 domain-containing protein [Chryseobacterium sp.]|nr:MAG: DUF2971 domain-containing protein [Chryseobacterium sp.]